VVKWLSVGDVEASSLLEGESLGRGVVVGLDGRLGREGVRSHRRSAREAITAMAFPARPDQVRHLITGWRDRHDGDSLVC